SNLDVKFVGLNTGDLVSIIDKGGSLRVPLAGTMSGEARLNWPGIDFRRTSGAVNARLTGEVRDQAIPVNRQAEINAKNGDLTINRLRVEADASTFTGSGDFSFEDNSDLSFNLASTDASQLQAIASSVEAVREAIDQYHLQVAGNFRMTGRLTGP